MGGLEATRGKPRHLVRRVAAFLAVPALVFGVAACEPFEEVWADNQTSETVIVQLEYSSPTDGYAFDVPPQSLALLVQSRGSHATVARVFDSACSELARVPIAFDASGIAIRSDGSVTVTEGKTPAPPDPINVSPRPLCGE